MLSGFNPAVSLPHWLGSCSLPSPFAGLPFCASLPKTPSLSLGPQNAPGTPKSPLAPLPPGTRRQLPRALMLRGRIKCLLSSSALHLKQLFVPSSGSSSNSARHSFYPIKRAPRTSPPSCTHTPGSPKTEPSTPKRSHPPHNPHFQPFTQHTTGDQDGLNPRHITPPRPVLAGGLSRAAPTRARIPPPK